MTGSTPTAKTHPDTSGTFPRAGVRVAVIPGDGIGKEVVPAALAVLDAVASKCDLQFTYEHFDWSCERYQSHGQMMPADGIDQLREHDAILLGAVGFPGVADHVSLWGLLIPIRRQLGQYVNLRPVRRFDGVVPPLLPEIAAGVEFWVVRENNEGEYSQIGGRFALDDSHEEVHQTAVFTRNGVDRIVHYAFQLARRLDMRLVTSATKSNGLYHSMPYWDERFAEVAATYPDVKSEKSHVDILASRFVSEPSRFKVVVASNLFGDILSDLGPTVTGTFTMAPSANLNPERDQPSMFEPVHGSAPDIAGRGIANPIGQIWSAAMMLDHLGETAGARCIMTAIEELLRQPDGPKTPDLGGTATTRDITSALVGLVGETR